MEGGTVDIGSGPQSVPVALLHQEPGLSLKKMNDFLKFFSIPSPPPDSIT